MADLVWVQWYATIAAQGHVRGRGGRGAPIALRYGATQYAVHVSNDDRYKITQMAWFARKTDWYRYWDGPEMIEFRARNIGALSDPDQLRVRRTRSPPDALGPEVGAARARARTRADASPQPQAAG